MNNSVLNFLGKDDNVHELYLDLKIGLLLILFVIVETNVICAMLKH